MEIDPAAFAPRYALAWCLTWARETEEAMKVVEGAIEQFGRHPWLLQVLTGLYVQRVTARAPRPCTPSSRPER